MTDREFIEYLEKAFKEFKAEQNVEVKNADVGFKDDTIFLLSAEEYERYKDAIPLFKCWWWLRSPAYGNEGAPCVNFFGKIDPGDYVHIDSGCVRPAIKNCFNFTVKPGQRFIKYSHSWIALDENLAIAEVPIATHRFDMKTNDYEHSEIRKFLHTWMEDRV